VDERLRSRVEEIVEEKVEESLKGGADSEISKIVEQKVEEKLEDREKTAEKGLDLVDSGDMDRRSFLKMLGLGGAGLGLAASGAAKLNIRDNTDFFGNIDTNGNTITDSTGQPVNINADTVDGKHASDLATANDLNDHNQDTSAHHAKYTDNQARNAVDGAKIDINGDADTVDGKHASDLDSPLPNPSNVQTASESIYVSVGNYDSSSDSATVVDASGPGWVLGGKLSKDQSSINDYNQTSTSSSVNITIDGTNYPNFSRGVIPSIYFSSSLTISLSVSASNGTGSSPFAEVSASVRYILT
jgi:hypothetical protein